MEGLREPSMARDFFRTSARDPSPSHRWTRKSVDRRRSREWSSESANAGLSQARVPEGQGLELQRPRQMAPLVLPSSRGKRVMLESELVHSRPSDPRPLHFTPSKAKVDGEASPTGPLELPNSPVSSEESPRVASAPDSKLARVRSVRSVSPSVQRRPARVSDSCQPESLSVLQKTMPITAAHIAEPVKQQPGSSAYVSLGLGRPSVDRVPSSRFAGAQQFVGQKEAVQVKAPSSNAGGGKVFTKKPKETVRQPTPFRRGLNALKGRLFSDARKDSAHKAEVQVAEEISRMQQELVAQHKVKPVEKQGLKSQLVQRLSRAFHKTSQQERPLLALPAPLSVKPESLSSPHTSAAPREEVAENTVVTESVSSISVMEWNALAKPTERKQPRLACTLEKEVGWMDGDEETSEEDSVNGSERRSVGQPGVRYTHGSGSDSDTESDSEEDTKRTPALAPPSVSSAGPVFRYPSWPPRGQRAMAQSWDMQTATTRATKMHSQRSEQLRNSEVWSKSGRETLAPKLSATTSLDLSTGAAIKQIAQGKQGEPMQVMAPSSQPATYRLLRSRTEIVPSQSGQARYSLDPYSSDEDGKEQDRTSRKQEMAAALHQLRAFQAGGAKKEQPQLQHATSMDAPTTQIVRKSASPLKTMLRSATMEGPSSGVKRLGASLLGGRSREPSPIRPGLLASPRRLRPEMSPQRVAPPPGRTSLDKSSTARWPSFERPSVAAAQGRLPGRASQTPFRSRPVAAAAAFFRSFTPGRQRPQVV